MRAVQALGLGKNLFIPNPMRKLVKATYSGTCDLMDRLVKHIPTANSYDVNVKCLKCLSSIVIIIVSIFLSKLSANFMGSI